MQRGRSRRCPKSPSARRPRWTPTSTLSAPWFIAQPTIFCQRHGQRPSPRHGRRGGHPLLAQAIMGIPSDRRFLATARKRLVHLFPSSRASRPTSSAVAVSRGHRVAHGCLCQPQPGLLRRPAAVRLHTHRVRSQPGDRPALGTGRGGRYGYCAAHSRFFWGVRLRALCAPDGTPRALQLASPSRDEREVALTCSSAPCTAARCLCDKGYAGRAFAASAAHLGVTVVRPERADEAGRGPDLAPIRQRIESIFWTAKDLLSLERHGARTMAGLRERVLQRFCCLAACVGLNHRSDGRAGRWSTTAPEAVGVESLVSRPVDRLRRSLGVRHFVARLVRAGGAGRRGTRRDLRRAFGAASASGPAWAIASRIAMRFWIGGCMSNRPANSLFFLPFSG